MQKTSINFQQNHVSWDCTYHVVIVPKYRKKVLFWMTRQRIWEIIRDLASRKQVDVIKWTACSDHVHMILKIPPKFSIAQILWFLKWKSAIRAHFEFSKTKKQLTQKSFWSRWYFVRTIWIDAEIVKNYVQNQWKHDKYIDWDQLDLKWD